MRVIVIWEYFCSISNFLAYLTRCHSLKWGVLCKQFPLCPLIAITCSGTFHSHLQLPIWCDGGHWAFVNRGERLNQCVCSWQHTVFSMETLVCRLWLTFRQLTVAVHKWVRQWPSLVLHLMPHHSPNYK